MGCAHRCHQELSLGRGAYLDRGQVYASLTGQLRRRQDPTLIWLHYNYTDIHVIHDVYIKIELFFGLYVIVHLDLHPAFRWEAKWHVHRGRPAGSIGGAQCGQGGDLPRGATSTRSCGMQLASC